jgi:hypothetical protein
MSKDSRTKTDWSLLLFLFAGLPVAFAYGGCWAGILGLVAGIIALGWRQRKTGPLSTNRGD